MAWYCANCGQLSTDALNTCRRCSSEKTPEQIAEAKARAKAADTAFIWGTLRDIKAIGLLGLPVLVGIGLRIGMTLFPPYIAEVPKSYGMSAEYMDKRPSR